MARTMGTAKVDMLRQIADNLKTHESYTVEDAHRMWGKANVNNLRDRGLVFFFDGRIYLTDDAIDLVYPA